ncbi:hypothetical protein TRIUR3_13840 [Triticum urartu]|uniref:FAD-binding domain-containing protein n=1 Tax=Triticum urartu TaxID=4572 RepID=M8A7P6_TRIUA|nr:hypothetical protein TRIUR3_13840 [Triticum urartu]
MSSAVEAEVVIVGAGIAGQATALALHRAGVRGGVLVLKRHAELRTTGAALTIFPSGWFALRALGVAHKLMSRYHAYETCVVSFAFLVRSTAYINRRKTKLLGMDSLAACRFQLINIENGATQVFRFAGRKNSGEIKARPADRKALLEALADELPPGTIRFSSPLVSIDRRQPRRVLIGCDGVHSVVARWLGLSEPVTCGRSAVRGLAVYPDGHGMKKELRQFLSAGLRASMVPISGTEVYWFLVNNTVAAAEEEAGADPAKILREVTDNLGRHMPAEHLNVVRHSDHKSVSRPRVGHGGRRPVPPHDVGPGAGRMLGAGGRGGARARPVAGGYAGGGGGTVAAYVSERRGRAAWLVAAAYLSGWVQQGGMNAQAGLRGYLVKLFRDLIFYRFIFPKLADTLWYDCGDLVPPQSKEKGKNHLE